MTTLAVLDNITTWWGELSVVKQVFYGIGTLASLVALLLVLMAVLGFDHDADGALDAAHGGPDGVGALSLRPLVGFFLGFGWAGGLTMDWGWSFPAALAAAVVSGGAMMALIMALYRAMLSLRSDGTMRIENAVGAIGTVYVTLPPGKASGGQVIVNFNQRQETFAALNLSHKAIPSGDKVRVLEIVDGRTVIVEPL